MTLEFWDSREDSTCLRSSRLWAVWLPWSPQPGPSALWLLLLQDSVQAPQAQQTPLLGLPVRAEGLVLV